MRHAPLSDPAPAAGAAAGAGAAPRCVSCEDGTLAPREVSVALWTAAGLIVVEAVPAFVCGGCGEQFYDDETAMKLDLWRGRAAPEAAGRVISVPVFRFGGANRAAAGRTGDGGT